jgi:hypothetical protein
MQRSEPVSVPGEKTAEIGKSHETNASPKSNVVLLNNDGFEDKIGLYRTPNVAFSELIWNDFRRAKYQNP